MKTTNRSSILLGILAAVAGVAGLSWCSSVGVGRADDDEESAARGHVEALCHAWTESPCLLRVAGTLHGEESREALGGMLLTFVSGGDVICSSFTDETGRASCVGVVRSGRQVAEYGYRIRFDGDGRFDPGSADGFSIVNVGGRSYERD